MLILKFVIRFKLDELKVELYTDACRIAAAVFPCKSFCVRLDELISNADIQTFDDNKF